MHQVIVQAHARGRGKIGQEVFAQGNGEIAAFGNFHAVGQRGGNIGKTRRHFCRGGEILAGGKIVRAAFVGQHIASGNAHPRFVCLEVVAIQKLGWMGGHHRQIQGRRQLQAAGHRGFPFRLFRQPLQLQIKAVAKPSVVFFGGGARFVGIAVEQSLADFAILRPRKTD